ncbi:MAG: helix-turn-helix transcriptional regulator [Armatimonadota bacterium]
MRKFGPGIIIEDQFDLEPPGGSFKFVYFGAAKCEPNACITAHVHIYHEILIITEGTAMSEIDGDSHLLAPGDLCIAMPGQEHQVCGVSTPWRYLYVGFTGTNLPDINFAFLHTNQRRISNCADIIDDLEYALEEARQYRLGAQHVIQSVLTACLVKVARRLEPVAVGRMVHSYSEEVEQARIFIERHSRYRLSLNDIASTVGISISRLEHIFSDEMGISVCRYARQVLMQRAATLVAEGRMNMSEVSEVLDFPSIHYFSTSFKKYWGVSPSLYKQYLRVNKN